MEFLLAGMAANTSIIIFMKNREGFFLFEINGILLVFGVNGEKRGSINEPSYDL
jgi:hypothetical protein